MIYLVTGGARSGKSSFAESLFEHRKDVVYIATSRVYDEEMDERIQLHRNSRPGTWRTYEGNYNLKDAIGVEGAYLLDCVTVLTSNIMFDITQDAEYIDYRLQNQVEDKVVNEIEELIQIVSESNKDLVLVTNEVGDSIVPDHHISRVFRDIQGRVNQRLAKLSDYVYLVCCGIPVKIK
ncbi:bifunctional adenosylcobinamide kinase/adenosylcobinamide-phosphate guanylyltransferase [Tissierella creatinini]|nr:bifunctional adenosylcobinamide kinase/adenosylcobinamide-phosphate guanylyltransferase [Tissierella creatinini]TJX65594.1 bifunctional adenosylcobinamide kinase/adenosylcobinamide-phosphate guanylyltransferase [Soehngenia saccharolytica]